MLVKVSLVDISILIPYHAPSEPAPFELAHLNAFICYSIRICYFSFFNSPAIHCIPNREIFFYEHQFLKHLALNNKLVILLFYSVINQHLKSVF